MTVPPEMRHVDGSESRQRGGEHSCHSPPAPSVDTGASSQSAFFFAGVSAKLGHLEECHCEVSYEALTMLECAGVDQRLPQRISLVAPTAMWDDNYYPHL